MAIDAYKRYASEKIRCNEKLSKNMICKSDLVKILYDAIAGLKLSHTLLPRNC